jgi:hypothetical protein
VRSQAGTWIIHKLTDTNDVSITIKSSEGLSADRTEEIMALQPGHAIIVGDVALTAPLKVAVRRRYTVHGGSGFNILDYIGAEGVGRNELKQRIRGGIDQEMLKNALGVLQGGEADEDFGGGSLQMKNLQLKYTDLQEKMAALRDENERLRGLLLTNNIPFEEAAGVAGDEGEEEDEELADASDFDELDEEDDIPDSLTRPEPGLRPFTSPVPTRGFTGVIGPDGRLVPAPGQSPPPRHESDPGPRGSDYLPAGAEARIKALERQILDFKHKWELERKRADDAVILAERILQKSKRQ